MFIDKKILLDTEHSLNTFINEVEDNPNYTEAVTAAIELRLAIQKELIGRR